MEYEDQERWLKERRQKENDEIIRHLRAVKDIIETKCYRCKQPYSCQGCCFSKGEMLGMVECCLKSMRRF